VRDVPVAAQDHFAPGLAQLPQVREEGFQEPELGRLAMRPAGARRQVEADHRQVAKRGFEVAALGVEFVVAEPGGDPRGCFAYSATPA